MRVHLGHAPAGKDLGRLQKALHDSVELTFGQETPADAQILVKGRPSEEELDALEHLKWVVIPFAGVPPKTRETLQGRSIQCANLHHNSAPTAEKAVSLLMAAAKRTVPMDRAMRSTSWAPRYDDVGALLLEGRHAVILGYGEIGKRIGRMCVGMGMEVSATKRTVRQAFDGEVSLYAPNGLDTLLPKANALIISLPLTDETDGLIGAEQLTQLPDQSVVVNIARGPVIDEEALYKECESGRLRAGLDVWWRYPGGKEKAAETAPSRFDFASLENVVMSPHVGGSCDRTEELRMDHLAETINRIVGGHQPTHPVDLSRGY